MNRRGAFNLGWFLAFFLFLVSPLDSRPSSSLLALLPEVPGWELAEEPRLYQPDNLFEYIDGAAESYLSYGFKELVVAQYKRPDGPGTLTLEIYRLDSTKAAFGIYSAERYPESRFLDVGVQGYIEDGSLNFVLTDKYVKLLSFEMGEAAERVLMLFSQKVEKLAGEKGAWPEALQLFPRAGLIANSEKFILRNFLGYGFLHDGYLASYRVNGQEFELFLVEGNSDEEANVMLEEFLTQSARRGSLTERVEAGYHIQDRYIQHIYLAKMRNFLAGVIRVRDEARETGYRYLNLLLESLKKKAAASHELPRPGLF